MGRPTRQYDFHLTADSPLHANSASYHAPRPLEFDLHQAIEVGVLLAGEMERHVGGHVFTMRPGDAWLCGMWEVHGWRVLAPGTRDVVVFFLPAFLAEEKLGEESWLTLFAAPPELRPKVESPQMRRQVLAIGWDLYREAQEQALGWRTSIRLNLLRLLLELRRGWDPGVLATSSRAMQSADLSRILPALRLVHESAPRHVSVPEAAEACRLSRSHFNSLFRHAMGESFARFQARSRLSLVAERLLTTRSSLDTIARLSGFAGSSHLHHAFTKHFGATPGDYRDRYSGSSARPARPD